MSKATDTEREKIAMAIEAQVRHLLAVPSDVTTVPRSLMALDLGDLAADVRRGEFA